MKKLLLAFLLGVAIASAIWIALLQLSPDEKTNALQTLDYLIDEWTSQREAVNDDARQAQVAARIELPNACPGFFPDTVRSLAHRIQSLYRIPKGVTLAQWALESNWGRNNLGVSNYFGHTWLAVLPFKKDSSFVLRREKVKMETGLATGQVVRFASYKSIAECFDMHGRYVSQSGRYRSAFATKSPEAFARQLSRCGYATDPDYGLKLVAIIRRYRL
jgi:flagellum-specific peptidoglycan hydrolase FlgJ